MLIHFFAILSCAPLAVSFSTAPPFGIVSPKAPMALCSVATSATDVERAQRSLLEARLQMEARQQKVSQDIAAQAAEIEGSLASDDPNGNDERAPMQDDARSARESRESKQAEAASVMRSVEMKSEAAALQESRIAKQAEAASIVSNAQRKGKAEALKVDRISKQKEAATIVRNVRMKDEAKVLYEERTVKQAEAAELMAENGSIQSGGTSGASQPLSEADEEALAQKYAAIEDLGERAHQILVDLGFFSDTE